ncbi:hypothetical protein QP713_05065 [Neisseria mucosa]|uniref:Uncharacterized protein n=1 Tax=Neisseria mucosa TaxID=488 RepID=A0AAW6ZGB5_NEIMU|nr:hypothetical protein [Neisseria mucosa]MDK6725565.1 hypothetical protein [Neisseria mucosa]MDK6870526.1 hypothetical protein [Neisseria mucosa]MDK8110163.1 hypothetical protein [Neisseria mucosa]MDK8361428.1 hypothetical protein [Neisseria mucosa]
MQDWIKSFFEIANPLIQFTLAGVGLWYCIETRKLRKESEKQTNNALMQKKLLITPYLLVGMVPGNNVLKQLQQQAAIQLAGELGLDKEQMEKYIQERQGNSNKVSSNKLKIHVRNVTNKIAVSISVYLYDHTNKNFLKGSRSLQVLDENARSEILVHDKAILKEDFFEEIKDKYGVVKNQECLSKYEECKQHSSLIFVVFRDIEGNTNILIRPFKMVNEFPFHQNQYLIS